MIRAEKKRNTRLNELNLPTELSFYLILGLFAALCIIPFVFVVIISFASEESIRAIGYSLRPISTSLQAYRYVFKMGETVWRAYFNSFYITLLGTALSVSICLLYA
ncbi:MAG: carbohydrate ABC transporter permease, partial [Clostridiales bacterium]|nr:carbohydrate ABC transporter permease [Clostridiales bacterium]